MTKRNKAKLLKAADVVLVKGCKMSCNAVAQADGYVCYSSSPLCKEYTQFYNRYKSHGPFWAYGYTTLIDKKRQEHRAMLILWFREVGLEGIGEV
jgi:hypothetical protein